MRQLLVALFVALPLAACTSMSGVRMTPEEAQACARHGCSVWTDAELQALALYVVMQNPPPICGKDT